MPRIRHGTVRLLVSGAPRSPGLARRRPPVLSPLAYARGSNQAIVDDRLNLQKRNNWAVTERISHRQSNYDAR
jgi:hypothetical protein